MSTEIKGKRSLKRRMLNVLGIIAVLYIGIILILLLLENTLLYHPMSAKDSWVPAPSERIEDVFLPLADGTKIHAWWCPPSGWTPEVGALIYCHGNAGNLSHRSPRILDWQKLTDLAVLIFDYPGYGKSEGSPSEKGCYAAADAAYGWLVGKVPPEKITIYGGSLGGGVAVDLGSRRPHRALVLVNTFTSIPDVAQRLYPFIPARWLVRNRFDSMGKIPHCKSPLFMAHGTHDELIPFALGQQLFEAAHEPKRFLCMNDHGHNSEIPADFYTSVKQFLSEVPPR